MTYEEWAGLSDSVKILKMRQSLAILADVKKGNWVSDAYGALVVLTETICMAIVWSDSKIIALVMSVGWIIWFTQGVRVTITFFQAREHQVKLEKDLKELESKNA